MQQYKGHNDGGGAYRCDKPQPLGKLPIDQTIKSLHHSRNTSIVLFE